MSLESDRQFMMQELRRALATDTEPDLPEHLYSGGGWSGRESTHANSLLRALEAGAVPPIWLAGQGGYRDVFCDRQNRAYKVAWVDPGTKWDPKKMTYAVASIYDEWEWFSAAEKHPVVGELIAAPLSYYPDLAVFVQECMPYQPDYRVAEANARSTWEEIVQYQEEMEWSAPEWKVANFGFRPDNTAVVVDANLTHRLGETLLRYIEKVILGKAPSKDRKEDLRFAIRREIQEGTITPERGREVLDKL